MRRLVLAVLLLPLLALSAGRGVPGPVVEARVTAEPGSTPPSLAASGPRLSLAWPDGAALAGVPARLIVQALTADGAVDPTRSGTVTVLVDDGAARVFLHGPALTELPAIPVVTSQPAVQARLPLVGGQAEALVRFASPGPRTAAALLDGGPILGGSPFPA